MSKKRIVDFHTHAFPDSLAPRAMQALREGAQNIPSYLDGTVGDLLRSMDGCGIQKSVICSIATKPSQFEPIIKWSRQIATDRIVPFCSIHPDDPEVLAHITQIRQEGFRGIKMHPFYQNFYLDEPRMMPLYERMSREGLMLVMHCGYDIAFPEERRADPAQILKITRLFPELKFIATHMGSWNQWDEVAEILAGEDIYIEISFALELLEPAKAKSILLSHRQDRLLFGTDSPWTDQANALRLLRELELPAERLESMLGKNAENLLSVQ
jgi:uncharacterized protein